MRNPAKNSFSERYSQDGICGASGRLDHGVSEGSDIARAYDWREGFSKGRVDWRGRVR